MTDAVDSKSAYKPMTAQEAAVDLGVSLSQRLQPRLDQQVPRRLVSKAEAEARGWSWFYPSLACRYGHQAARRTSNDRICSDCERVKAGEESIYGKSKTQRFYPEPRRKSADGSAPVIAAPIAQPAQVEPTPKEQNFLAALDETRDFDAAAQRTSFSRSQIEARVSVNHVFRKALTDLCERRGIAWTRAPDAETFSWTPTIERQFAKAYVDCGMLAQARNDLGISASDFHARLAASPTFASLMEDAHPLAALTLRDRATQAAAVGKIDLLKYLESNAPKDDLSNLSVEQMNAELEKLLKDLDAKGMLGTHRYRHRVTGEIINLKEDYVYEDKWDNTDLVGGAQ